MRETAATEALGVGVGTVNPLLSTAFQEGPRKRRRKALVQGTAGRASRRSRRDRLTAVSDERLIAHETSSEGVVQLVRGRRSARLREHADLGPLGGARNTLRAADDDELPHGAR